MNKVLERDFNELLNRDVNYAELRNKTVLITGANGFIAKYLVYFLLHLNRVLNLNIKILALVRNAVSAEENFGEFLGQGNIELIIQDICDELKIDDNIDYVIHAASSASAVQIAENPLSIIDANVNGTINLLEICRKKQIAKVIFFSTREVYGKVDDDIDFINEDVVGKINQLDYRSAYPESKRMAENIFVCYGKLYGIPFDILRIAHCYGPCMKIENDGRVMADMIYYVANNQNIRFNSDGSAQRAFCYISDMIYGLFKVLFSKKHGEVYNLANESELLPIREVAEKLLEVSGNENLTIEYHTGNQKAKQGYLQFKIAQMDTCKLDRLGWKPMIDLNSGLKRTLDYFREIKEN